MNLPEKKCLEVCWLNYSYADNRLFSDLSFSAQAGTLLQIVGPNGVGKTTLLKLLAGLLLPEAGQIRWGGVTEFTDQLYYLDHLIALKSQLTVLESFLYDQRLYHRSIDFIQRVLDQMQLQIYSECLVGQLSRGQRQRLALAKLLCSNASLFILDEPLTALDSEMSLQIKKMLAELVNQGNLVVLTNHFSLTGVDCPTEQLRLSQDVLV